MLNFARAAVSGIFWFIAVIIAVAIGSRWSNEITDAPVSIYKYVQHARYRSYTLDIIQSMYFEKDKATVDAIAAKVHERLLYMQKNKITSQIRISLGYQIPWSRAACALIRKEAKTHESTMREGRRFWRKLEEQHVTKPQPPFVMAVLIERQTHLLVPNWASTVENIPSEEIWQTILLFCDHAESIYK